MSRQEERRITVHVVWRKSRGQYILRAVDASSSPPQILQQKSTGTAKRHEADRMVPGFLEEACRKHAIGADGRITWARVCQRFDAEELAGMSAGGRNKFWNAINRFDAAVNPRSLYDVTADAVSRFRGAMQQQGLAQDTQIGYLSELSRCLRWAAGVWTDFQPPAIRKPKRKQRKGPRGRPIANEEFDRMLRKTAWIVGDEYAREWRRLLIGLRLSGLRIGEALTLSWDRTAKVHVCDLDRDRARLYFTDQKSHKEGKSPITKAFDRFLRKTPADKRKGFVLRPQLSKGRVCRDTASRTISEIGRSAGIIVGERLKIDAKTGEPKTVKLYASAHDLRRTFATKLAPRVKSAAVLAMYLRDTVATAESYYLDLGIEVAERATRRAKRSQKHDHSRER
jgi:integrase